jgi:hypothetical protein
MMRPRCVSTGTAGPSATGRRTPAPIGDALALIASNTKTPTAAARLRARLVDRLADELALTAYLREEDEEEGCTVGPLAPRSSATRGNSDGACRTSSVRADAESPLASC